MTEYKISSLVSLPINTDNTEFIPSKIPYEGNKVVLEQVALSVKMNKPVLLSGETGTGKTSIVRYLASKTNNGFRRVNLNGGTGTDELLGKMLLNKDGTYWLDGVLVEAMKKGFWLLLDEINASSAEVLFTLYSLLDDDGYIVLAENSGEIVRPHKNFRLFASMNPSSDYVGTKEMNKALMSRFVVVKTDFPIKQVETSILQMRTGIKKAIAEKMVAFAKEVRTMAKSGTSSFILSTRELIQWSEYFNVYNKFLPSAEISILNKVLDEDMASVRDLLSLHFKALDNPNSKRIVKKKIEPELKVNEQVLGIGKSTDNENIDNLIGIIVSIDQNDNTAIVNFAGIGQYAVSLTNLKRA